MTHQHSSCAAISMNRSDHDLALDERDNDLDAIRVGLLGIVVPATGMAVLMMKIIMSFLE